jgi:hypothetical protein
MPLNVSLTPLVLHRRNRAYAEGRAALPPVAWHLDLEWSSWVFGVGATAVVVLLVGVALWQWGVWWRLRTHGQAISAIVTAQDASYDPENGTTYSLRYRFVVNDQTYEAGRQVPPHTYTAHPVGAQIAVRYNPAAPQEAWPAEEVEGVPWGLVSLSVVAALFAGAVVYVVWQQFSEWWRWRRIWRTGQAVIGHVLRHEVRHLKRRTVLLVDAEFVSPKNAQKHTAKGATYHAAGHTPTAPPDGSAVLVWQVSNTYSVIL